MEDVTCWIEISIYFFDKEKLPSIFADKLQKPSSISFFFLLKKLYKAFIIKIGAIYWRRNEDSRNPCIYLIPSIADGASGFF